MDEIQFAMYKRLTKEVKVFSTKVKIYVSILIVAFVGSLFWLVISLAQKNNVWIIIIPFVLSILLPTSIMWMTNRQLTADKRLKRFSKIEKILNDASFDLDETQELLRSLKIQTKKHSISFSKRFESVFNSMNTILIVPLFSIITTIFVDFAKKNIPEVFDQVLEIMVYIATFILFFIVAENIILYALNQLFDTKDEWLVVALTTLVDIEQKEKEGNKSKANNASLILSEKINKIVNSTENSDKKIFYVKQKITIIMQQIEKWKEKRDDKKKATERSEEKEAEGEKKNSTKS